VLLKTKLLPVIHWLVELIVNDGFKVVLPVPPPFELLITTAVVILSTQPASLVTINFTLYVFALANVC
jgi:hypothetical protein